MQTPNTNEHYEAVVEKLFTDFLEGRPMQLDHEPLTSDEITVIHAKLAAKFAAYAGDAINF